jgi:hypothetical protein
MSHLHKLAEVTIAVYGLPEYCGTDEALQELTEDIEDLLETLISHPDLSEILTEEFPGLADKLQIVVKGIRQ